MADPAAIHLTFEDKDVAVLTLDDPRGSANVLSRSLLEELEKHLNALENRSDLAGLVIRSGKPGVFIVGADIREFLAEHRRAERRHRRDVQPRAANLFARLSKMPFVTVTAIDGQCVGGGAELALWCDRRVVAERLESHVRLSRGQARPAARLGRHGPRAARAGPGQRHRIGHQRRIDRREYRGPDGPGQRRRVQRQIACTRPSPSSVPNKRRAIGNATAKPGRSRSISATPSWAFWAPRLRP